MSAPRTNYADPRKSINTSDHTYQSALVTLVDSEEKPLMAVKGCTWNLMNYGISLKTSGIHKNNPWDFDENHQSFMTRKTNQLNKILAIISSDSDGVTNDFFLLQEVDIFFPASSKLKVTPEQQADRDLLTNQFHTALRAKGWEMILKNGSAKQQACVTLYNCKSLQPVGMPQGVFPTTTQQCRGLEQAFLHLTTGKNVMIVNLHLDYEADYTATIPQYQKQQAIQGKFTIMGGDTNHAPNQEIVGLINTWHNITNLSGEMTGISHLHKDSQHIKKCYDGFFANPTQDPANSNHHTAVRITEQAAEVFVKDAEGEYIVTTLPANPHVHRSAPGQPWRRGGYSDFINEQEAKSPNEVRNTTNNPQQNSTTSNIKSPDAFFTLPNASTQPPTISINPRLESLPPPGEGGRQAGWGNKNL